MCIDYRPFNALCSVEERIRLLGNNSILAAIGHFMVGSLSPPIGFVHSRRQRFDDLQYKRGWKKKDLLAVAEEAKVMTEQKMDDRLSISPHLGVIDFRQFYWQWPVVCKKHNVICIWDPTSRRWRYYEAARCQFGSSIIDKMICWIVFRISTSGLGPRK